jgi:hypothetical protein
VAKLGSGLRSLGPTDLMFDFSIASSNKDVVWKNSPGKLVVYFRCARGMEDLVVVEGHGDMVVECQGIQA